MRDYLIFVGTIFFIGIVGIIATQPSEKEIRGKTITCQVAHDHMMIYEEGSPFLKDVGPIVENYCK